MTGGVAEFLERLRADQISCAQGGTVRLGRQGAMSDDTVIGDAVTMIETMAGTCTRLRAVMTVLSGSEDAGDEREARGKARHDVEAGFRALLYDAARLAVLQPDIGRALTAREAP